MVSKVIVDQTQVDTVTLTTDDVRFQASLRLSQSNNEIQFKVGDFWLPLEIDYTSTFTANTKVIYQFSGQLDSFVVPANTNYIYVKMWGAGGGPGTIGGWSGGSIGGGGGHSRGLIPVIPGEVLTISIGEGGKPYPQPNANAFGGGGSPSNNTDGSYYGGGGGGYTGIFRGNPGQNTALIMAGGGGGGGSQSGKSHLNNCGGPGGGLKGVHADSPYNTPTWHYGGWGANTAYGGKGGTASYQPGTNGKAMQGGGPSTNSYGGGGGGGYFGGGGGSHDNNGSMTGGGGGSGYLHQTVLFGESFVGWRNLPGKYDDYDLPHDTGDYNTANTLSTKAAAGWGAEYYGYAGNGYMVIFY